MKTLRDVVTSDSYCLDTESDLALLLPFMLIELLTLMSQVEGYREFHSGAIEGLADTVLMSIM